MNNRQNQIKQTCMISEYKWNEGWSPTRKSWSRGPQGRAGLWSTYCRTAERTFGASGLIQTVMSAVTPARGKAGGLCGSHRWHRRWIRSVIVFRPTGNGVFDHVYKSSCNRDIKTIWGWECNEWMFIYLSIILYRFLSLSIQWILAWLWSC